MIELTFLKEIDVNKTSASNECDVGISLIIVLSFSQISVIDVMIY